MIRSLLLSVAIATIPALAVGAGPSDPPADTVLAKRGDTTVTVGDFLAYIYPLDESQQFTFRGDLDRINNAVSSIYRTKVLAQRARADGIDQEPAIRSRLRLQADALLAQAELERMEKSIEVPNFDDRAREIYKGQPDTFRLPPVIDVYQIMVSSQGRTDAEAAARASEARAKLVAGEDFLSVAREYSNDPNFRVNQGRYRGSLKAFPASVAAVIPTAERDKPSEVIKSPDGYHIVVVHEYLPATTQPYEKAKESIIRDLEDKYRRGEMEKKMLAIVESKEIVLYTDDIAKLKTQLDLDALTRAHKAKAEELAEEYKERKAAAEAKGK